MAQDTIGLDLAGDDQAVLAAKQSVKRWLVR